MNCDDSLSMTHAEGTVPQYPLRPPKVPPEIQFYLSYKVQHRDLYDNDHTFLMMILCVKKH